MARGEVWPKRSEKNNKKTTKMRTKVCNKINTQIKKPHLKKRIRNKDSPESCFSSHFCFLGIVILLVFVLSVLFLVAVISPSLRFSM